MSDLHNRLGRRRRAGEDGFTLIELLVVIAILSVLAAIVIINVTGVKNTANTAACNTDAQEVQTALLEYYDANNDAYPPGWAGGTPLTTAADLAPLSSYLSSTSFIGTAGSGAACASMAVTVQAGNGSGSNSLTVTGTANTG